MEINTMEIGKMIKEMDKESLLGKVETSMKVNKNNNLNIKI